MKFLKNLLGEHVKRFSAGLFVVALIALVLGVGALAGYLGYHYPKYFIVPGSLVGIYVLGTVILAINEAEDRRELAYEAEQRAQAARDNK